MGQVTVRSQVKVNISKVFWQETLVDPKLFQIAADSGSVDPVTRLACLSAPPVRGSWTPTLCAVGSGLSHSMSRSSIPWARCAAGPATSTAPRFVIKQYRRVPWMIPKFLGILLCQCISLNGQQILFKTEQSLPDGGTTYATFFVFWQI